MKKIIAVLLVVFLSCFSLVAEDIPVDWYIQIIRAIEECHLMIVRDDYTGYEIEKIDDKTVKVYKTPYEYYFRFNLTIEEERNDKLFFFQKALEFYPRGNYSLYEYENIRCIQFFTYEEPLGCINHYSRNFSSDGYISVYPSLTHFFYYYQSK